MILKPLNAAGKFLIATFLCTNWYLYLLPKPYNNEKNKEEATPTPSQFKKADLGIPCSVFMNFAPAEDAT